MLSAALLLFANTLLFSLRLSGGGSFPKPLSAAEEREYLRRYAPLDFWLYYTTTPQEKQTFVPSFSNFFVVCPDASA